MGFVQNVYQRGVSGLSSDLSDRGLVELRGIDTGEPMTAVAEQVVAELPVCLHVEGLVKRPEPYDLLQIDPARHLPIGWQIPIPASRKGKSIGTLKLLLQAHRRFADPIAGILMFQEGNDLQMLVEIRRSSCSDAQRVDLGMHEAVEVVENHRRVGGAEP